MTSDKSGKPPTMADIARLAGVHTSTVSRALAGSSLVEAEMREKIVKIARSRGYKVNWTARSLRLQRTQTISVAIPLGHEAQQPLSDPFFMQMLGYLADEITQRGYGLFLQKVVPPMADWLDELIASKRADGVIVIGQSTEHAALEAVATQYKPLVVWGGQIGHQAYCTVGSDNIGGGRLATEHLLQLGRRRVVFLGDTRAPEFKLRYQGYADAMRRAGKGVGKPKHISTQMTATKAFEAVSAFIAGGEPFDAVFAATDVIAIGASRAIAAAGLSVPGDVSIVGYDDLMLAAHMHPPLTTVRQDIEKGARYLVDLLFRRLDGEDTEAIMMSPELIIRESCAPLKRKGGAR